MGVAQHRFTHACMAEDLQPSRITPPVTPTQTRSRAGIGIAIAVLVAVGLGGLIYLNAIGRLPGFPATGQDQLVEDFEADAQFTAQDAHVIQENGVLWLNTSSDPSLPTSRYVTRPDVALDTPATFDAVPLPVDLCTYTDSDIENATIFVERNGVRIEDGDVVEVRIPFGDSPAQYHELTDAQRAELELTATLGGDAAGNVLFEQPALRFETASSQIALLAQVDTDDLDTTQQGMIQPVTDGLTQARISGCGDVLEFTLQIVFEDGPNGERGSKAYANTTNLDTRYLEGWVVSDVITTDYAAAGRTFTDVGVTLTLPEEMLGPQALDGPIALGLRGTIEMLASADGGQTWKRPRRATSYVIGDVREERELEYDLAFKFDEPGTELVYAVRLVQDDNLSRFSDNPLAIFQCDDGSQVDDLADCPEVVPVVFECENGQQVASPEDCVDTAPPANAIGQNPDSALSGFSITRSDNVFSILDREPGIIQVASRPVDVIDMRLNEPLLTPLEIVESTVIDLNSESAFEFALSSPSQGIEADAEAVFWAIAEHGNPAQLVVDPANENEDGFSPTEVLFEDIETGLQSIQPGRSTTLSALQDFEDRKAGLYTLLGSGARFGIQSVRSDDLTILANPPTRVGIDDIRFTLKTQEEAVPDQQIGELTCEEENQQIIDNGGVPGFPCGDTCEERNQYREDFNLGGRPEICAALSCEERNDYISEYGIDAFPSPCGNTCEERNASRIELGIEDVDPLEQCDEPIIDTTCLTERARRIEAGADPNDIPLCDPQDDDIVVDTGDDELLIDVRFQHRDYHRTIVGMTFSEGHADACTTPENITFTWGEAGGARENTREVYYLEDNPEGFQCYTVLRGLNGGMPEGTNSENYDNGRGGYEVQVATANATSDVYPFETLNRTQSIQYSHCLVYGEMCDTYATVENMEDYLAREQAGRKEGLAFWNAPERQNDSLEPVHPAGVRYAMMTDERFREFSERFFATVESEGDDLSVGIARSYRPIHDRLPDVPYPDGKTRPCITGCFYDDAGVEFWREQVESIAEVDRIDVPGYIYAAYISEEGKANYLNLSQDSDVALSSPGKCVPAANYAYLRALRRAADTPGALNIAQQECDQYASSELELDAMIRRLSQSQEKADRLDEVVNKYKDTPGSCDGRAQAVSEIYQSCFGRAPDVEGVNYWACSQRQLSVHDLNAQFCAEGE